MKKMGHDFSNPVFWVLRRKDYVFQYRWWALGTILELGFLLDEQNLCCIAAWSPCSCWVLIAAWKRCLRSVASNSMRRKGVASLAVEWLRIKLSHLAFPTVLPLLVVTCLTLVQMQPGRSQNGLDNWFSSSFSLLNKHFILYLFPLLSVILGKLAVIGISISLLKCLIHSSGNGAKLGLLLARCIQ